MLTNQEPIRSERGYGRMVIVLPFCTNYQQDGLMLKLIWKL
jgi:hypothetical protein